MPNEAEANKIIPLLHPAIDNKIIGYLREKYPNEVPKRISSIASVDEEKYHKLCLLVSKEINKDSKFKGLNTIQWEDIIWLMLSNKDYGRIKPNLTRKHLFNK